MGKRVNTRVIRMGAEWQAEKWAARGQNGGHKDGLQAGRRLD